MEDRFKLVFPNNGSASAKTSQITIGAFWPVHEYPSNLTPLLVGSIINAAKF